MNMSMNINKIEKQKNRIGLKQVCMVMLFIFTLLFSTSVTDKKAQARCCVCCPQAVLQLYHVQTVLVVTTAHTMAFTMLRDQLLSSVWWHMGVKPLLQQMALELNTAGWSQVAQIGAFIDGKVMNETLVDMQVHQAKIAKRQIPAVSMCKFASLNKSLAQADSRARMVHNVLNEYSLSRTLGDGGMSGATKALDTASRYRTATSIHCDRQSQGGEMVNLCSAGTNSNGYTSKDINFTDAIDSANTINLGFDGTISSLFNNTDTNPYNNNEVANVMAMKSFLYQNELPPRAPQSNLAHDVDGHQSKYLRWRGSVAKRTVAENSFDSLVGMKTASGVAGSAAYQAQLASLGASAADIAASTKAAPSYWAQMEQLTKTIYQNPDFYMNLYDNPNNVIRQSAAMEAVGLMQMRDYYESLIRSEMALSIMLDTEVSKEIDAVNNVIAKWGY